MNHFLVLMFSISLGGMAWGMLVVSDWLLRDKPKGLPNRTNSESCTGSVNCYDRSERARATTGTPPRIALHDHFTKGHRQMG
jgi:hypothetical protein